MWVLNTIFNAIEKTSYLHHCQWGLMTSEGLMTLCAEVCAQCRYVRNKLCWVSPRHAPESLTECQDIQFMHIQISRVSIKKCVLRNLPGGWLYIKHNEDHVHRRERNLHLEATKQFRLYCWWALLNWPINLDKVQESFVQYDCPFLTDVPAVAARHIMTRRA